MVVDDSIVRGSSLVQLVRMLRQAGAKEIHIRINCPEDVWPCFYGVDTGEQSQLISATKSVEVVQLVRMLRQAGAKEIHIRINCPEDVWPCFYGVDTGEQSQLISATKSVEEVCEFIGYPVAIPESFGRDKFIEGYTPRNLSKPEPITGR